MSAIFSSIVDVEFDKFVPDHCQDNLCVRFNQPLLVSRPALTSRAGQLGVNSQGSKIAMMEALEVFIIPAGDWQK